MTRYYDTGILLKLYTIEPESEAVWGLVTRRRQALLFTSLHHNECVSALRLKLFRRECREKECAAALRDLEEDMANGVLLRTAVDWHEVMIRARALSEAYAAATGCRTLDALHVGSALYLGAAEFVTSDVRQFALARKAGLRVVDPVK